MCVFSLWPSVCLFPWPSMCSYFCLLDLMCAFLLSWPDVFICFRDLVCVIFVKQCGCVCYFPWPSVSVCFCMCLFMYVRVFLPVQVNICICFCEWECVFVQVSTCLFVLNVCCWCECVYSCMFFFSVWVCACESQDVSLCIVPPVYGIVCTLVLYVSGNIMKKNHNFSWSSCIKKTLFVVKYKWTKTCIFK